MSWSNQLIINTKNYFSIKLGKVTKFGSLWEAILMVLGAISVGEGAMLNTPPVF